MPDSSSPKSEQSSLVSHLDSITDASEAQSGNETSNRLQRETGSAPEANSLHILHAFDEALTEYQHALSKLEQATGGVHQSDWKLLICEVALWVQIRNDDDTRDKFLERYPSAVLSQRPRANLLSFLKSIHPRLSAALRTRRANAVENLIEIEPSERLQVIMTNGGVDGVARLRKEEPSQGNNSVPAQSIDDHVKSDVADAAGAPLDHSRPLLEEYIEHLLAASETDWASVPHHKVRELVSKLDSIQKLTRLSLPESNPPKGSVTGPEVTQ